MDAVAITRPVPDALARCELTHLRRVPIDVDRARTQHEAYERVLSSLGCALRRVAAAPDLPDSTFVEDTAIVLDEVAVVARPGAESRRPELPPVVTELSQLRPITFIVEPGTLDGGDVLRLGRTLYVGVGGRTNADGVRQLTDAAAMHGYQVRPVRVRGCLHLKSAVTEAAPDTVLLNPEWVDGAGFEGLRRIEVDPREPYAANVLRLGETVVCASSYGRTNARLDAAGFSLQPVDVSELAKAEGALTCCSLIVPAG